MGTLRLYELPCEVQKLIGESGGILPPEFYSLAGARPVVAGARAPACPSVATPLSLGNYT